MPAALEARICELRRPHPGWGQRRPAHELVRDGVDPPPGLTSIYRAPVRNGLIQPKARRRPKTSYRRWERARPMELWQLDIMGGIWLTDGRELKAVTGIDDHFGDPDPDPGAAVPPAAHLWKASTGTRLRAPLRSRVP
jgi:hypothetical protein